MKNKFAKKLLAFVLTGAMLLALAACTKTPQEPETPAVQPSEPETPVTPEEPSPAESPAEPEEPVPAQPEQPSDPEPEAPKLATDEELLRLVEMQDTDRPAQTPFLISRTDSDSSVVFRVEFRSASGWLLYGAKEYEASFNDDGGHLVSTMWLSTYDTPQLSAQATDKGVNIATARLFPVANTAEQIAALGVEGVTPFIQTIGLYRNKAKNVVRLSEIRRDEYAGEVPEDFDKLVALPGVGRKTANVVLNVAFGHPTIPVDTHIFRVSNRTGLAKGKTPDEIETKLEKIIPDAYKHEAHHWLLLHGRYCCKARSPECERCPVAQWCNAPEKKKRLADFGSPSKSE